MGLSSSYLRMRLVCLAFEDALNGNGKKMLTFYMCAYYILLAPCWFICLYESLSRVPIFYTLIEINCFLNM